MSNQSCSFNEKTTTTTMNQLDENHIKNDYNNKNQQNNNDDDGFTLVKSKKSINNNYKKEISNNKSSKTSLYLTSSTNNINLNDLEKCVDDLYNKINKLKYKLKYEDDLNYYSKLIIIFERILNDFYSKNKLEKEMSIICYGLGSIDDNLSSRYQFALLLLLIEDIELHFKIRVNLVEFFDPVFNKIDISLLTSKFKFQVESENLKCMKQIKDSENRLTMFYMPHCGKALYNNLLYSNWSIKKLKNLLIFGNSFTTMRTQTLNNLMSKYYTYINDSYLFLNEIRLCNMKCDLTNDSFYDLSLHLFNVDDFDFREANDKNRKNSVIFSSSQIEYNNNNDGSIKNELVNHLSLNYEVTNLNKPVYDNLNDLELI